jgi:type II secretory pathway component PulK
MRRRRRSERGGVMVQALIVLAGLVALLATLAADERATLQATQNRLRDRRAEVAARSAVQRALAVLAQANTAAVTQNDDWYLLGDRGNEAFDPGDGTTFRMQIIDNGSLVNINTVNAQQLQMLPLTQEQIDSLLDWRSAGQTPRANGAKDTYYTALDQPYNTKLGQLTTLSELLLVKGWTAQTLYGTQSDGVVSTALPLQDANGQTLPLISLLTADAGAPNRQATGAGLVNLNQRGLTPQRLIPLGLTGQQAATIIARAPIASFRALLTLPGMAAIASRQLLSGVTFTGNTRLQGKINLNTAPQTVLETIPNVTPEIASAIVAQQTAGFQSLGDLLTVPGANGALLPQIADAFTVGSDTWTVRAYGESGGYGVAVEAVVGIRNNRPQVITYRRLPDTGVPAWWDWNDTTTATVDAGGGL